MVSVDERERATLAFWNENGTYARSLAATQGGEPYVIYDGPPTANALPVLHTMLPMTFKDAMGRYQTMRGRFVRRQNGWDTHGLPVEVQVEKALGLSGKQDILKLVPGDPAASVAEFNRRCRESVWKYKEEWERYLPRTGYWTDVERPYMTCEPQYVEGVWAAFAAIWDGGHVFKDYRVAPYCPRCGTGLSAAEAGDEYRDVKDTAVYVRFPRTDRPGSSFLAWTTTPWTLPGHVALAVNPELTYVEALLADGERVVLGEERLAVLPEGYEVLRRMPGSELVGATYAAPFPELVATADGRKFEVVPAGFVTAGSGTAIVHTAVMYGEDDFKLGVESGLARIHAVGPDGRFLPAVPRFAGMLTGEALVPILKALAEIGALFKKESYVHAYPHCWRCKTPLIYYALDSWYVRMSAQRGPLVAANAAIEWVPDHVGRGRFGNFVAEARDWAVSRSRFWGTPLPVWKSEGGEYLRVGSFAELRGLAEDPSLVPEEGFDPHLPGIDAVVLVKDGVRYYREPYVLDVWFDSGCMPFASGRAAAGEFPAEYVAEAVDQTRGWFYSLTAIGVLLRGGPAFRRAVCMGHLVDGHGKKMSKSVGNVLDPWGAFGEVGADALRWFFLSVNAAGDTKSLSLKEVQASARKFPLLLGNVANYLEGRAAPSSAARAAAISGGLAGLTLLDRWALSRLNGTRAAVTDSIEAMDFLRAARTLEEWASDLSTWYLRRSRGREDDAFVPVLAALIAQTARLAAPFIPFAAEELWQGVRSGDDAVSVHLTAWPEAGPVTPSVEKEMGRVRGLAEDGQRLRAGAGMKVRQPLRTFFYPGPALGGEASALLKDELNVLGLSPGSPETALDLQLDEGLERLGLRRDLQRHLQQARKDAGLMAGEAAVLVLQRSAAQDLHDVLDGELLASIRLSLQLTDGPAPAGGAEIGGTRYDFEVRR